DPSPQPRGPAGRPAGRAATGDRRDRDPHRHPRAAGDRGAGRRVRRLPREAAGAGPHRPLGPARGGAAGGPRGPGGLPGPARRAGHGPAVGALATPIETHVPLATEALAAGCDVYLEKPPVPARTDHWALLEAAQQAGRAVQVGFQARGGGGVDVLRQEVASGAFGPLSAVHVHGAWQRDRAYYSRSAWAGRRRLEDGRRVADGVATNPLAHAVHAGLAIAGIDEIADISGITTELRRAHDIQADDTTFL